MTTEEVNEEAFERVWSTVRNHYAFGDTPEDVQKIAVRHIISNYESRWRRQYQDLKMAYLGMAQQLCEAKRLIGKLRYMSDHQGGSIEQVTLDDETVEGIDRALEDVALHTGMETHALRSWSPFLEPKGRFDVK